jgi:hypothetical protein
MDFILHPWQLYFLILDGWVNRQQQTVIDYLRTENQVLREKLGKKRILLNDDQRRRLVVRGQILGWKMLQEIGTIFTPDTILRWHRQLVAQKWDHSEKRKSVGRPRLRQVIVDLILRFAQENPPGATTASRAPWPTWATGSPIPRSETSSKPSASSRLPIVSARDHGVRSSKRTGTCWRPSTSPRLKSGPRVGWSRITCCS